jgi:hypothetical protein
MGYQLVQLTTDLGVDSRGCLKARPETRQRLLSLTLRCERSPKRICNAESISLALAEFVLQNVLGLPNQLEQPQMFIERLGRPGHMRSNVLRNRHDSLASRRCKARTI